MSANTTPPRRLEGKVCIITGSSSGLGRAIALAYTREGALLTCADLRPDARAQVASELSVNTDELVRQGGGKALYVKTDVSKPNDMEELVRRTVGEYGRVDVLVNNAGIAVESGRAPARCHETSENDWDLTMAVNAKSVYLGCKYALKQMLQQEKLESGDRGWIINMSSIYGLVGGYNNCSYAASKAAVTNLTRSIALDYAKDGIHCNSISPGYTATAIFKDTITYMDDHDALHAKHPLHGIGRPEDIAGAAVFLASTEARWITGVALPVDGGFTAH